MKRRELLKAAILGAFAVPVVASAKEKFEHEEYSIPLEFDHSALPEYNPKPYIVPKGHYIANLGVNGNGSGETYEVMVDGVNLVDIDIPKQVALDNLKLRDL